MMKRIIIQTLFIVFAYSCTSEVNSVKMHREVSSNANIRKDSYIEDSGIVRNKRDIGSKKKRDCCRWFYVDSSSDEEEVESVEFSSKETHRLWEKSKTANDRYLPLVQGPGHSFYVQTSDGINIRVEFKIEDTEPFVEERKYWHVQIPDFCTNSGFIATIPPTRANPYGRDTYNSKKLNKEEWTALYIPTEMDGEKVSEDVFNKFLEKRRSLNSSLLMREANADLKKSLVNSRQRSSIFSKGSEILEKEIISELEVNNNDRPIKTEIKKELSQHKGAYFHLKSGVEKGDINDCLSLEEYPHWILYHKPIKVNKELKERDEYPSLLEAMLILLENPGICEKPILTSCCLDNTSAKTISVSYNSEGPSFTIKTINPDNDKNHTIIPVKRISETHVESTNCGFGPFSATPAFCCGYCCVRPKYLCQFCYCPPTCKWPCGVATKCCECGIPNCCCVFPCCCLLPCAYCPAIPGVCIEPTSSTCWERFECSLKGICWCR